MNKLKLLANLPIYVDKIPIYSPLLKNLAEVTLEQYGLLLTYSTITVESLIESTRYDVKSNFDALISVLNATEGVMNLFLTGLFFFTKIEFLPEILDDDLIFIYEDIVLNRNNYDSFVYNVKFVNRMETENAEELDEFDRRVLEQEKKINDAYNRNTEQPNFSDLISAVANFDGNGLNIINIWDLNIYQFYEQLQRGQMKEQYRWNLQQLLAGAKPDDINLESYLKNIK